MMMGGGSSVQDGANGHEGAGIEILDVAFVKVSHANFFLSRYMYCLWG